MLKAVLLRNVKSSTFKECQKLGLQGMLKAWLLRMVKSVAFKKWDHVYFVHPSTDVSVDISTDARPICRPTIGRYLGRYSGRHSADTLTVDYRRNIGRLSVVYRSTVL